MIAAAAAALVIALLQSASSSINARHAPAQEERSIAVLPFENLSSDKDNAFFAEGIQDEIAGDLAKLGRIESSERRARVLTRRGKVAISAPSRGNLAQDICSKEPSRETPNQIRVTLRLVDSRDPAHAWTEAYQRPAGRYFLSPKRNHPRDRGEVTDPAFA